MKFLEFGKRVINPTEITFIEVKDVEVSIHLKNGMVLTQTFDDIEESEDFYNELINALI